MSNKTTKVECGLIKASGRHTERTKTNFLVARVRNFFFAVETGSIIFWPKFRVSHYLIIVIFWFCKEKFYICFWIGLIVHQKKGLLFKRIKISKSSDSVEFIVFLCYLAHVFLSAIPTKKCEENSKFSESVDLKKQVKRPCFHLLQETRFSDISLWVKNKTKNSAYRFAGITT